MNSQYALQIVAIGKPLVQVIRPIPVLGEGEILVKVTSAGLNPHDQKLRDFGLWGSQKPLILADDVAGIVTSLGSGVTKYKVGDHVFAQSKRQSPTSITDDEATTIPVNSLSPFIALFHPTGLAFPAPGSKEDSSFNYAEKTLVIVGGGANCGKFGVQFTKMVGFGKVVVVAGKGREEGLKRLGATHVVDRRLSNEEIKKAVIEVTGGDNVKYVYDALNADHTFAVSLLNGNEKGIVAALLPTKTLDEGRIGEKKGGYEVKKVFGASHAEPGFFGELFWKKISVWIERSEIKQLGFKVVEGGLNEDGVNAVLDEYRDGGNPGKWHVHPSE